MSESTRGFEGISAAEFHRAEGDVDVRPEAVVVRAFPTSVAREPWGGHRVLAGYHRMTFADAGQLPTFLQS